jgi:hypothetical protein
MSAKYQGHDPFSSPAFNSLREFIMESGTLKDGQGDFEEFEQELHRRMSAFEADLVGQRLAAYDIDVDEVRFDGQVFRRKDRNRKEYCGLAGTFEIERNIYVPRSHRGGKAICPLELRAGIVEGTWTPVAARVMVRAVAGTTPKEAAQLFEEIGGMKPSTSSLDRLPKQLSEKWEEQRLSFEDELRSLEPVPPSAVSVAVSLDGVQVPMKDGERAEKRSKEDKRPQGPAGFREVGCGTVSLYDAEGERLSTVRFGRMPETKKTTLKSQLEAELESIFAARPDLILVSVADGFEDNWDFLAKLSPRFGRGKKNEAIDLFHVLERVKVGLDAFHGDCTPESKAAFEQCRIWLREKSDGAERVIRALRHRQKKVKGEKRKTITGVIGYLSKRKPRLRYKRLLDRKLPVGSGVMEAACKTLATERMKRSGMSWLEEGGQAILTFRSLIQSGRWQIGWGLLAGQYKHEINGSKRAA